MERQITLGDVIAPAKVLRCDNDDYPVLSMTMHDGIVLQSNRFKKSLVSIDQSNYKVVLRGQLVVGFPIDEGVIYVQNIAEAGIMSPAYGVWNIHSKEILPEYLELCLHSPQSMDYYKNKLRGTTARRRSITTGDLLALPIILPSLTEQKRRIGLFRQTTLLLNSQKQTMLKFDELVKSRFVEMFGDPVSNPHGFERVALSQLAEIKIGPFGSLLHKEDYIEGGHPLLNPSHISEGRIVPDDKLTVSDSKYAEMEAYHLHIGDIVMGRRGEMGRCAVVPDEGYLCGTGSLLIRTKGEVTSDYLQKVISFPTFKKTIEDMAVGQTMPNLNVPIVSSFQIIKPPIDVQRRYYAFVAEVDKSKLAVKQSLEELETLKKSLMQQYFG